MEQDGQKESHNGVKDGAKELTERQMIIVEKIRITPTLSAIDLAQKTGISFRTLQRELSILQKKGFVRHKGGRKLRALVINFYGKIVADFSTDK